MTYSTKAVRRVAVPAVVLAFCLTLWVRSYWTTDTLTYCGSTPSSLSVSSERGLLWLERSRITTASDRTLRYWHGRPPIESDPKGEGTGGFHHYAAPSGSWSWTIPFWAIAVAIVLTGIYSLRRRTDPTPTPSGTVGL